MKLNSKVATRAQRLEALSLARAALSCADMVAEQSWVEDGGSRQEYKRDVVWHKEPTAVTLLVSRNSGQTVAAIIYGLAPYDSIMYDARVYMARIHNSQLRVPQWDNYIAYAREDYREMRHEMALNVNEAVSVVTIRLADVPRVALTA